MLWMRPVEDLTEQSSSPAPSPELHLRELVVILRRRIWIILGLAVVGTALAAIVGLMISPKYTAIAQLVVEPQPGLVAERMPAALLIEESVDTHLTLISSRDHLRRVAENLARRRGGQLASSVTLAPENAALDGKGPESVETTMSPPLEARATILDELKRRANIWINALRRSGTGLTPSLEELERGLRVNQERRSRVISVAFTSKSPESAAALANYVVRSYIAEQSEQASEDASSEIKRLRERIADVKSDIDKSGRAVRDAIERRIAGANAAPNGREPDAPLHELERDLANNTQLYSSLLRREKDLRDLQATATPGVRVLALAAPPERPSSHNPILFIAPAMILALIGGGLLAVMLDRLDQSIRSPRELAALGITCIGAVPCIRRAELESGVLRQPFSPYVESMRAIVAALGLATADSSQKLVLITSSQSGEGKTTLASSLATYLASIGRRVLLADLNLRHTTKPTGFERRGPILAVAGAERLGDDLIQRNATLGFDYLTMSGWPDDPLGLFAGDQFCGLLRRQRANYDCIIMDGPPLLGTAEARLLPGMADESLLVVRWGRTRKEDVQAALGLLERSAGQGRPHELAAAVITQVKGHARSGYRDAIWSRVIRNASLAFRRKPDLDRRNGSKRPVSGHAMARAPSASNN